MKHWPKSKKSIAIITITNYMYKSLSQLFLLQIGQGFAHFFNLHSKYIYRKRIQGQRKNSGHVLPWNYACICGTTRAFVLELLHRKYGLQEPQNLVQNSFSCPRWDGALTGTRLLYTHLQFRPQKCQKPVKL